MVSPEWRPIAKLYQNEVKEKYLAQWAEEMAQ